MIEFKELKFKNVLSYGNNYTTYNFETGISTISAPNGVGKSTIIEAFYYGLFGRPYRAIKKSLLINAKNKKGLEVFLTFNRQNDVYRIERGMKPDFFKIYKNDVLVPVSSSVKGYQEILEEDIFQFDENITNQVTIKSLTRNMSFIQLSKAEKRKIVENLLDIEVFSIMGKNLKLKIDKIDITLKDLKKAIDNKDLLIGQEQENIEKLRNLQAKMLAEATDHIKIYTDEITELTEQNIKYNKGLDIIKRKKVKIADVNKNISNTKNVISDRIQEISKYEATQALHDKKIKFLEKTCGDCPKIKELMNDSEVENIDFKIKYVKVLLAGEKVTLSELEDSKKKINDILANEKFVVENLHRNTTRISALETHINKLKTPTIEINETKLNNYKTLKSIDQKDYNKQSKIRAHLVLLRNLCADDGIKTFIIKKYLPTINKLLNTYLTKFQTDIVFTFDAEFNEIVLTKNKEDFTYDSFSQGQKKRIDLAVMFAFIKFAQMKNKKSDTNLLILDEVLTSLDQQGTESVMEVLADYRDKNDKCIITINHLADIDTGFFDHSYKVCIDKGFSKITKETL